MGDQRATSQCHHRIEPAPTPGQAGTERNDGQHRSQCVGQHMHGGGAVVVIVMATAVPMVMVRSVAVVLAMPIMDVRMTVTAVRTTGARAAARRTPR